MSRPTSYSYPPTYATSTSPPKQYPAAHSMSSAFSASANPNEDWTKISDLAERRRIQNRIAQRNYRKKLKKRLEDLERRAGSSSASPEQQPAELVKDVDSSRSKAIHIQDTRRTALPSRSRTPDVLNQQYLLPTDDRSMFSQQYTRQLSTSPPPFTYASMPITDSYSFPHQSNTFCSLPPSVDQVYSQYLPPIQQQHYQTNVPPMSKPEYYGDDDISPFSMTYASIGSVDVSAAQSYPDVAPYTPPLLDSFEYSTAGSPPETMMPRTPASMPRTPPLLL